MARSLPADDLTGSERHYLESLFTDPAIRKDHEDRVRLWLRRFARRGFSADQLHAAIGEGTAAWFADRYRRNDTVLKDATKRTATARAAFARAADSLRRLLPGMAAADDEWLIDNRNDLLNALETTTPRRPGRPWAGKRELDDALRKLKVPASDRRELSAALGFISDDD